MPQFIITLLFLCCIPHLLSCTQIRNRRILHQPFFPLESLPPAEPPSSSPQRPKFPFSSSSSANRPPFFPFYASPPPPPSHSSLATFPANISSLLFPGSSSSSPRHVSRKLVAVAVSVSLLSVTIIAFAAFLLVYHRRRRTNSSVSKAQRSDCLRLFPADAATSDEGSKPSAASSELLYLGTRVNSREGGDNAAADSANVGTSSAMAYQKLDSPELHPLPPLPRQNYRSGEVHLSEEGEEEEFYSPRESSGDRDSPDDNNGMSSPTVLLHTDNLMSSNSISRSPSDRYSNSLSPVSSSASKSSSPLLNVNTKLSDLKPASSSPPHSPPQIEGSLESESGNSPTTTSKSPATTSVNGFGQIFAVVKQPPPPPPLPPPRFWEIPLRGGPPVLAPPLSSTTAEQKQSHDSEAVERDEKTPKPKLKPLHWDKVRASSDRAMVWDQLKSSSFQ